METAPCPLGCEGGDEPVLRGRDRLHGLPGLFSVVRCRGCGLMRTDPRPAAESIGFYYPPTYAPFRSTQIAAATTAAGRGGWKQRVRGAFDFRHHPLPRLPRPGRMLEVGCASGAFLYEMARRGWEVEGIESAPAAAAAARRLGFPVHTGPLETAPDPAHAYDLVVGWMVLEHLHEPLEALRKLRRWTRPGAWLAASVPNAGAYELALFRDRWYALQLPTHLFHYTAQSLRRLLERAGWRLERVLYQRDLANVPASVGYWLQDHGRLPRLARRLVGLPDDRGRFDYYTYPLAWALSGLGQTGRMTIWARRGDD